MDSDRIVLRRAHLEALRKYAVPRTTNALTRAEVDRRFAELLELAQPVVDAGVVHRDDEDGLISAAGWGWPNGADACRLFMIAADAAEKG